ncbi:MAG: TonB-dependent hemoglobin/transferrin/lactoferrin family receptor [Acidobacteria bacterium]|nr:TonB-dependent hemoglobin/transferrin/lactoferrin family receptor [Acidobacteriota bacterium]MCB9377187.1 TonB-dependent hemoglobin/transferrin/lactoferrin family receptor [Holophagales bacterium]
MVGSQVERPVGEIAGTASVVDRQELDRRQAQTLEDLVRYEPSISVVGSAGRFGSNGFRIRGVDGNRVAIEVDGVPVAEGFSVGSFADAGRDLVEPELLRTVEILRGPASAAHGGDALGGVVVLTTRRPTDFLAAEESTGGALRLGYDGRDEGRRGSGTFAAAGERWRFLGLASFRRSHETGNQGAVPPDPADAQRGAAFLRLERAFARGLLEMTLDREERRVETNVRHLVHGPGQFATTERLLGDDRVERTRILATLLWGGLGGVLDETTTQLYWSESATAQETAQWRSLDSRTPYPTRRDRRFEFREELAGAKWIAVSEAAVGGFAHRVVWGGEVEATRWSERRDGRETNLDSGAVTNVLLGEELPVRDLPISKALALGFFAADEIALGEGRWRLQPALRYDRYTMDPRPDRLYREDFPDLPVVGIDVDALTPKLGLIRDLGRDHSVYLQYAEGFRAPPAYEVNIGLRIPIFDYEAVPNPDLEPERSRGVEIGWRLGGPRVAVHVAAFENRYVDLIESRVNLGRDPETGVTRFQSVNRDRARIRGLEGRLRIELGAPGTTARGWSLDAAFAWAEGEDTRRDRPLNSVDPARLQAGLSWTSPDGRWWASAAGTWVASKEGEVDTSVADLFTPAAYSLLDLYCRWQPRGRWSLDLALLNAFDRKYWSWGRARGLVADDPLLDFYTAPGRALLIGVSLEF